MNRSKKISILFCIIGSVILLQSCAQFHPMGLNGISRSSYQFYIMPQFMNHNDDDEVTNSTFIQDEKEEENIIIGKASFYGSEFNGRKTANGEIYDETVLTAAHRSLPFGTFLSVTNVSNGRTVIVRVNDRGPFHPDRILDVSRLAAEELDMIRFGVAEIEAEILEN